MPAISLEGVTKSYPAAQGWHQALENVSLSVEAGAIQGIIGFSGAGKTTLLRCVSRLERPDSGRVVVDGSDLVHLEGQALRVARRRIGIVFQQFHLLRSRSVVENVGLPLEIAGESRIAIADRVGELLEWFGLSEKADAYPAQLSGGQRQRVAIARALAARPAVLLSDEPTSALDAESTAAVLDTLRRVRDEMGVTILLVTHELDAVRAICDRVAVLEHGRIVEEATVEDLFLRPSSAAARRLLGKSARIEQIRRFLGEKQAYQGSVFLSVQFIGGSTARPLLSQAARISGADLHLLHGEIGQLRGSAYGNVIVEALGDGEAVTQAIHILRDGGAAVTPIDPWSVEAAL